MVDNRECQKIRDLLSPYLDGRVTPEEKRLVEAHLEKHEACRAELESLRATVGLLKQVPSVAPRRSFAVRAPQPAPEIKPFGWLPIGALRLATGFAVLLLVGLVMADALGSFKTVSTVQQFSKAPATASQSSQATPGPQLQQKSTSESAQDKGRAAAPMVPQSPAAAGSPAPAAGAQSVPGAAPTAPSLGAGPLSPTIPAPTVAPASPSANPASPEWPVRQLEVGLAVLVVILTATLSIVTLRSRRRYG